MSFRTLRGLVAAAMAALFLQVGISTAQAASSPLWSDVSPSLITPTGDRVIAPLAYRATEVDRDALAASLALAPLEGTREAANRAVIELPLPDGNMGRFAIVESPIMAPELQAQFPEIRTYAGYGIEGTTALTRLDLTPMGFHAIIFTPQGQIYIDPFQRGDVTHYQSYWVRDHIIDKELGGCTVVDDGMSEEISRLYAQGVPATGGSLRTYRAAVACTGEYSTYQGGTVPLALAGITTSMNRVDGVYENELAIRMVLIANETSIIYLNGATDPYTNGDGGAMLTQNQNNLDNVIGSANYDIGHVFSTGGGGIAGLGVVCRSGLKAEGVTGSGHPSGDSYDIDYVAHEMGHQFGGNHAFNGISGSCAGGNRHASTAYEPGSGSTIMNYAGICGVDNLQQHSDPWFSWIGLQEIQTYTTTGQGHNCPTTTATGVIDPVVSVPPGSFSIPISTPFALTASATVTGTPTYDWEESDLGPAGHPDSPSGTAPIFRSFNPTVSGTRIFPKLNDILTSHHTIGELLPTYARVLSFKVTVRDTQAGGVGVSNGSISFNVASVGPFTVTSPTTLVHWPGGSLQTITWNVSGTDVSPVNCHSVNILLSTDGGNTFPTTLVAATANDGSEAVVLPPTPSTTARVKVAAADNIFFDLSDVNFEITAGSDVTGPLPSHTGLAVSSIRPNPFTSSATLSYSVPTSGYATLSIYDPSGRLLSTLVSGTVQAGTHEARWNGTDAGGRAVGTGVYLYKLNAMGRTVSGRMTLIR